MQKFVRPTSAARTLDMVVAELGETRDNLRLALEHLEERPVPHGGKAILDELSARARAEGVADDEVPLSPDELRASQEPVDGSQVGIAVLLGGSALVHRPHEWGVERGLEPEGDAGVDAALAEVPVERARVAVPLEERTQIPQVGRQVLRRDGRVLPSLERVGLAGHVGGGA